MDGRQVKPENPGVTIKLKIANYKALKTEGHSRSPKTFCALNPLQTTKF
jgi:hypothetical protein